METPAKKKMAHGICWKYIQTTDKTTNSADWGVPIAFKLPIVFIKMTPKDARNGHSGELAFCYTVTEVQFFF